MTPSQTSRHLGEDELDRYSRGTASEDLIERVEEHLLICEACVRRAQESDAFVEGIESAAPQFRKSDSPGIAKAVRIALPMAAGVAIVAGGLLLPHFRGAAGPPVAIRLEATRGPASASAPENREIILRPDLSGLAAFDRYRIEMVDALGGPVWRGWLTAATPEVRIGGRRAGAYFVRVYSPDGALLREYGLRIGG